MPEIVDWHRDTPAQTLARVVGALRDGRLVALPTESGYELAAAALNAGAVGLLQEAVGTAEHPAVVLTAGAEVLDWLPWLPAVAARLPRKLGSGPWKLMADGGAGFGLLDRLPAEVRAKVCKNGHLALRWPEPVAWAAMTRALWEPIVSAGFVPPPTTAMHLEQQLGNTPALIVDAGPSKGELAPTVVRVTGKHWAIERPGGLPSELVEELLLCRVLFVCTGNTCRSPMAEALFTRLLADRFGCQPGELRQRGFCVQSAGLAAMMGAAATGEALAAVREWGADLSAHRSQPLTMEMLVLADHVFAMTESHLWALEGADLPDRPPLRLLSANGGDVSDPIGGPPEVYRACAQEIRAHLQQRLAEIQ